MTDQNSPTPTPTSRSWTDLRQLLDRLVADTPGARSATIISADGLLHTASGELTPDVADQLCAAVSGIHSLAAGFAHHSGDGRVQRTSVEMDNGLLFVTGIGRHGRLAARADADADMGVIAWAMEDLVKRVGNAVDNTLGPARRPHVPPEHG
jgi:predicted regulator of Ras-like GTPase activity (Roadblock/LC7/MglB family)